MPWRIRILGPSGSGKSTLARRLQQLLQLDTLIHIDDIFWQPGWQMTPRDELRSKLLELVRDKANWIVDGNYSKLQGALIRQATHVIIIDPPLWKNLWQLF